MNDYKFKYLDLNEDNEFKVFFDITTQYVNKEECCLEIDGDIYLEDHNGNEYDFKNLSEKDQNNILNLIDLWIENEQIENGSNYYQDSIDSLSDYYFDQDR